MAKRQIIVGARGSLLSVAQAQGVIRSLRRVFPSRSFSLKKIITFGDRHKRWQRDDTGIFVKELEEALRIGEIDIAVHSMKDLPTQAPAGLSIAAVTKREDPRDCLISKEKIAIMKLKKGAIVGTSSLRRRAQLLRLAPGLKIKDLRGNLDTRMKKLTRGEFDAIVVAMAGVIRLGVFSSDFYIQPIPASLILPAPGQGALALEVRAGDKIMEAIAKSLNHGESSLRVSCERAFLGELGGGCRLPVGAFAEIKNGWLRLRAAAADEDGKIMIRLSRKAPLKEAESLGKLLACECLKRGGGKLITRPRNDRK
ncbi:hydroxymethylbilane synthase [bacterium]|nr:MAG: hydroxymethylbilane synthase [bacterium]